MYASILREWKLPSINDSLTKSYDLYYNLFKQIDLDIYSITNIFSDVDIFKYEKDENNLNDNDKLLNKYYLFSDDNTVAKYTGEMEKLYKIISLPVMYKNDPNEYSVTNTYWVNKNTGNIFFFAKKYQFSLWYDVYGNVYYPKIFYYKFTFLNFTNYWNGHLFGEFFKLYEINEIYIDNIKVGTFIPNENDKQYTILDFEEYKKPSKNDFLKKLFYISYCLNNDLNIGDYNDPNNLTYIKYEFNKYLYYLSVTNINDDILTQLYTDYINLQ